MKRIGFILVLLFLSFSLTACDLGQFGITLPNLFEEKTTATKEKEQPVDVKTTKKREKETTKEKTTTKEYNDDDINFSFELLGDGTYSVRCEWTNKTTVEVPSTYNGKKVTHLDGGAFSNLDSVVEIIVSDTILYISDKAFDNCISLEKIYISKSVKEIGPFCIAYCPNVKEIIVDQNNKVYDSRKNCNAIIETSNNRLIQGCKTTVIPNTVKIIGDYAFYYCEGLESICVPEIVEQIDGYAFFGCTSLNSITLSDKLLYIGEEAFGSTNLRKIYIPYGIEKLSTSCFRYCNNLEEITIPETVTTIEDYCFDGCDFLKKVNYNGSKSDFNKIYIGPGNDILYNKNIEYVFNEEEPELQMELSITNDYYIVCGIGTYTDKNLIIPETYNELPVKEIADYAFRSCSSIESLTISKNIIKIGKYAFQNCKLLVEVFINSNIDSISEYAFYKCVGLTRVYIPKSVTIIENGAFSNCSNLCDVYYEGTETEWNSISIFNYNSYLKQANKHYEVESNLTLVTNYLGQTFTQENVSASINDNVFEIYPTVFEGGGWASYNKSKFELGTPFEIGKTYRLVVEAKTDINRKIKVSFITADSTWSKYGSVGNVLCDLTNEYQKFEVEFTYTGNFTCSDMECSVGYCALEVQVGYYDWSYNDWSYGEQVGNKVYIKTLSLYEVVNEQKETEVKYDALKEGKFYSTGTLPTLTPNQDGSVTFTAAANKWYGVNTLSVPKGSKYLVFTVSASESIYTEFKVDADGNPYHNYRSKVTIPTEKTTYVIDIEKIGCTDPSTLIKFCLTQYNKNINYTIYELYFTNTDPTQNKVDPSISVETNGEVTSEFTLKDGVYTGVYKLYQWNYISINYSDGKGNDITVWYDNTTITGNITAYDAYGCYWNNDLYHEVPEKKWYHFAEGSYDYYKFEYNPTANTLVVSHMVPGVSAETAGEVVNAFTLNNGIWTGSYKLSGWDSISLSYSDEKGNKKVIWYDNTTVSGDVADSQTFDCLWNEYLFQEAASGKKWIHYADTNETTYVFEYNAVANTLKVSIKVEEFENARFVGKLNNKETIYPRIYDSTYAGNISLDEYTIATDSTGKIIFASRTSYGYGGPADGFYHDGNYTWTSGQVCGIFNLGIGFSSWFPGNTQDPAPWTLYSIVCPEGYHIITGSQDQMAELVKLLTEVPEFNEEGNNLFENVIPKGALNIYELSYVNGAAFSGVKVKKNVNFVVTTNSTVISAMTLQDNNSYVGVYKLSGWDSISFTYDDTTIWYDNTKISGDVTGPNDEGCPWNEKLYHDGPDKKLYHYGDRAAEYYRFEYYPLENTLIVFLFEPGVFTETNSEVVSAFTPTNGVYTGTFKFTSWNSISLSYLDENGNNKVIWYDNTTIIGDVTGSNDEGCPWNGKLFHEGTGKNWFHDGSRPAESYRFVYDPVNNILVVNLLTNVFEEGRNADGYDYKTISELQVTDFPSNGYFSFIETETVKWTTLKANDDQNTQGMQNGTLYQLQATDTTGAYSVLIARCVQLSDHTKLVIKSAIIGSVGDSAYLRVRAMLSDNSIVTFTKDGVTDANGWFNAMTSAATSAYGWGPVDMVTLYVPESVKGQTVKLIIEYDKEPSSTWNILLESLQFVA